MEKILKFLGERKGKLENIPETGVKLEFLNSQNEMQIVWFNPKPEEYKDFETQYFEPFLKAFELQLI